jgi:hypothetical protein
MFNNHLRTVVSNQSLNYALQVKGLSQTELRSYSPPDYITLEFLHSKLICLNRRSRVIAARDIPLEDQLWLINLFYKGKSLLNCVIDRSYRT